jgi:hypothetical protein
MEQENRRGGRMSEDIDRHQMRTQRDTRGHGPAGARLPRGCAVTRSCVWHVQLTCPMNLRTAGARDSDMEPRGSRRQAASWPIAGKRRRKSLQACAACGVALFLPFRGNKGRQPQARCDTRPSRTAADFHWATYAIRQPSATSGNRRLTLPVSPVNRRVAGLSAVARGEGGFELQPEEPILSMS